MDPTDKLVLLDNTVLSNFAFVHRADLITNIWKNCATTSHAWDELQNGILTKKTEPGQWEGLPLLVLNETEISFWQTLPKLGNGESSCLAAAYCRQAIFATDDAKARAVGMRLGMEISGTVGFLLFAVARQATTIQEANSLLKIMITAGYRSPVKDLGKL